MFHLIRIPSMKWSCGALLALSLLIASGAKAEEKFLTSGSTLTFNSDVLLTEEEHGRREEHSTYAGLIMHIRELYFFNGRIVSVRKYDKLRGTATRSIRLPIGESYCSLSVLIPDDQFADIRLRAGTPLFVESFHGAGHEVTARLSMDGNNKIMLDCRTVEESHSGQNAWKRFSDGIPLDVLRKALGSNVSVDVKSM